MARMRQYGRPKQADTIAEATDSTRHNLPRMEYSVAQGLAAGNSRSLADPGIGAECDTMPVASAATALCTAALQADGFRGDSPNSVIPEVRVSQDFTVTFVDDVTGRERRAVTGSADSSLLDAARVAGIEIVATCGARGRCRSCRVKVLRGHVPPATVQDTVQLGHDEVRERFRLACQTRVIADCTIRAMPPKAESGHQLLAAGAGDAASAAAIDSGVEQHVVRASAPVEEHHQSSDIEEILGELGDRVEPEVPLAVLRKVPTVLRKRRGTLTVTAFGRRIIDIEAGDTSGHMYGMAFDIGTTSIVGSLVDLATGEQLAAVGSVNPQAVYGGDLMSRIAFAQFDEKKLTTLRARALTSVNNFIKEACGEAGVSPGHVYKIVIAGNTCMHHVFLGIDVSYVGLAPYAPVVRESLVVPAGELPLKGAPNAMVCFLPIVAGFVGADTVAAMLATRIFESDGVRVLVDIGTNGEVVMGSKDRLMACSAPAGPALEGGQIKHGMRGAVGAIERVNLDEDVHCGVIGDAAAIGICGSGLVDAVAKMLDAGVLNGMGRMRYTRLDALPEAVRKRLVGNKVDRAFVLVWGEHAGGNDDISLTQLDVRQFQLAKGAIFAGILMLQEVMDVPDERIDELLLCGGFGNYINVESAVRVRLLPALPIEKITYVGNAAHLGAQIALLSETERRLADEIARRVEHVALATRAEFQTIFVNAMNLEEDESLVVSL